MPLLCHSVVKTKGFELQNVSVFAVAGQREGFSKGGPLKGSVFLKGSNTLST